MTVSGASLDESGSKISKIAATSLLLGVTRTSSEAYSVTDEYGTRSTFVPVAPDLSS